MKRIVLIVVALCIAVGSFAQKKITFVPQWTPQSQFAGYYMALEKGYYADEGLDVDIQHIGVNSTESVMEIARSGRAQIFGQQLLQSIVSVADGFPLVNILQVTQVSGLWCVSHKPVSKPEDLDGLRVGKWKVGYSEFCDMMEASSGIHVDWVPFINGINLFVFGAVDAILCYSYSEFIALQLALGSIPDENVLKFSEFGYECPEDALFVTEDYYKSDKDAIDGFVRASRKGWEYVRNHRDEALDLCMKYVEDGHVTTNRAHQRRMLDEYLDLQVNPKTGLVDFAPVDEKTFTDIVDGLMNVGYITRPVGYSEIIR